MPSTSDGMPSISERMAMLGRMTPSELEDDGWTRTCASLTCEQRQHYTRYGVPWSAATTSTQSYYRAYPVGCPGCTPEGSGIFQSRMSLLAATVQDLVNDGWIRGCQDADCPIQEHYSRRGVPFSEACARDSEYRRAYRDRFPVSLSQAMSDLNLARIYEMLDTGWQSTCGEPDCLTRTHYARNGIPWYNACTDRLAFQAACPEIPVTAEPGNEPERARIFHGQLRLLSATVQDLVNDGWIRECPDSDCRQREHYSRRGVSFREACATAGGYRRAYQEQIRVSIDRAMCDLCVAAVPELLATGWRRTCEHFACVARTHYARNGIQWDSACTDRAAFQAACPEIPVTAEPEDEQEEEPEEEPVDEPVYDFATDDEEDYLVDDYDEEEGVGGDLHGYGYKPAPIFHGNGPVFLGMELECTTDFRREAASIVAEYDGILYAKADGSVDGIEMVTHPMSLEWAMESFPWRVLDRLRNEADATTIPEDNGIHVHVDRDGFTDSAHLYRWLKFWYRNPRDIQRIARRRSEQWSAFSRAARDGQYYHAMKHGKAYYDRYDDETRMTRYAAINTQNEETLEVRVFASSLRKQRVLAALQLVAGTVEYTRGISASDVIHRGAWEWNSWVEYARQHAPTYDAFLRENEIRAYI